MNEIVKYIDKSLEELYTSSERKLIASLLIEKIIGLKQEVQFVNKNTKFSEEQCAQLVSFIERLKKNVPLQYILGKTEFYGLKFLVDESVLIPRPETEELVEWIILDNINKSNISLLDIGTGSGCIPIAIGVQLPHSSLHAIDISDNALKTAKKNSERHNIKVNFHQKDVFTWNTEDMWDIIISNPPYIPEKEKQNMDDNVLLYEPHEALFVPDDKPLMFYKQIAEFAIGHLNSHGKLYFEIHYDKGKEIVQLLNDLGFINIQLRKDISGQNRMVKAEILKK